MIYTSVRAKEVVYIKQCLQCLNGFTFFIIFLKSGSFNVLSSYLIEKILTKEHCKSSSTNTQSGNLQTSVRNESRGGRQCMFSSFCGS